MDVNAVVQAIGSLGFPIVAACGCFWYLNKEMETHRQETAALTKALQDNTIVMAEIKEILTCGPYGGVHENSSTHDIQRS
jgi:cobyrinic acid a,c-diamide synthase